LSAARDVISAQVRNMGYYYFQPDFIEYLADTVETQGQVVLKLTLAENVKSAALRKYYVRDVEAVVNRPYGRGTPDTLKTRRGTLIRMQPMRLNENLVPSCLRFRKGRIVRVRDIDQTQLNLSRMGIFSTVNIDVTPLDSIEDTDSLDFNVVCTLDQPMEAAIEFQATSKTNSYIGPALVATLTNKNLFGGGEQLTTQITAGYEWQTGSGSRENDTGSINSYEFGLNSTLSFPRLLAPKFIDRSRRYINWTRVSLSADLLNRPSYFKMVQFGAGFSWEWHANRNSLNEFTPFKLTYTKMLSTTDAFNAAMEENPAVALSFKDQFVPLMSYSYTYDKQIDRNNNMVWTSTVMEAGNIFSGIWSLAGKHGEKELFGTPFSQFVKAQTQLVYSCKLFHHPMSKHWMVFRLFAGAAHAYGNTNQVPYSEQFYIGGANSLRAFGVRAVGPGSYRPAADVTNGYYDQTGTFKLEFNGEYRFPLMGYLHGAIFLDAGNVWLLEKDASRPGGALGEGSFFKQLAVGTGAGLRFDMEMLVLRADLGIGLHAPYDTGKSGYFNMPSFKKSLAFHIAIGYPF
jgi:outer membrane protein assembly factor BamA